MQWNATDAIPTVAVEAKFKKLLREALEKGILASKVGMLKLIPKAGTAGGVEAVGELRVRWSFQVELETPGTRCFGDLYHMI